MEVDAGCVDMFNTRYTGWTSLYFLIKNNHIKHVEKLFKLRIGLREFDRHRSNALHVAAETGNARIAEMCLMGGINVNSINNRSCTPLHFAVFHNHKNVVELLLNHNAVVGLKSFEGKDALDYAVEKGNEEIISLLMFKISLTD